MKILPCPACRDGYAKLSPTVPYFLESFPGGGRPWRYTCAGCKRRNKAGIPTNGGSYVITVAEFHALPEIPRETLEQLGLLDILAKDLTFGGEIPLGQAKDLFVGGLSVAELESLGWQTS